MNHPDILDRLQRHRDRIAASTIDTVARHLAALALEIQESPVLGPALAGLLGSPAPWIGSPEEPPTDLHTWGADAAAVLLTALHEVREGKPFYHCLMPFLNESHRRVLRDESSRTYLLSMFIDPILEWAAFTLGAIPAFSETVRRWAIRVEAFGIPGLPTRRDLDANPAHDFPDERAFQLDLARFLYDQGFDLGRLGREQVLRERTGQGARIDFLLRDQREVAVELMVARSASSLSAINHHVVGLRDYCRTANAAHGMLVVVNLDPKRRLDIRPVEVTAPSGVHTGGAHLLVAVVEARRANASAKDGRPAVNADLSEAERRTLSPASIQIYDSATLGLPKSSQTVSRKRDAATREDSFVTNRDSKEVTRPRARAMCRCGSTGGQHENQSALGKVASYSLPVTGDFRISSAIQSQARRLAV